MNRKHDLSLKERRTTITFRHSLEANFSALFLVFWCFGVTVLVEHETLWDC